MGATTGIEWADATVNVWTGCAKVSPACKHCYAETNSPVRVMQKRVGLKMWGASGFRYETAGWEADLRALNRRAKRGHIKLTDSGAKFERPRVFINSLSDTFEDFAGDVYRLEDGKPVVVSQSLDDVRARFFRVAEECAELDILLLTKRPENVLRMVPYWWHDNDMAVVPYAGKWPSHVWVGTTVEDQEHADKRIPKLLKVPAKVRFLSVEPLLGKVALSRWATRRSDGKLLCCECCHKDGCDEARHYYRRDCPHCKGTGALPVGLDWVIVGGESGKGARPMHPDWVRSIRDQCQAACVPFFFKQWGEWLAVTGGERVDRLAAEMRLQSEHREAWVYLDGACSYKVGKKNAGRLLDGREWNEVPK